jgi:hypothetical protein
LLPEDSGFIGKGESSTEEKDIAEIERILKAPMRFLKSKHLNP